MTMALILDKHVKFSLQENEVNLKLK